LDDGVEKILQNFSEKIDYYFNRRWEENTLGFERVLKKNEDSVPSLTYLDCCINF
tara:strand:- start:1271 stop:1435 length:165 start_codon:yes stop_codon:yes gene_type:complete